MLKTPWVNFMLCGVSLTSFGMTIPSPFTKLELTNSETATATSFTLSCTVGGDDKRKANIAAFEALLYSSAQSAASYSNSSGVPVAFAFGWLDGSGNISDYLSYQGFVLKFNVSTSGQYLVYNIQGMASLSMQFALPTLRIPELSGIVQPSAVLEGLAIATKATSFYELDIDHNDAPTLVSHTALSTSFNTYVRGSKKGTGDDYDTFPGLLALSKSYSSSRDAAGLAKGHRKLSTILNNATVTPIENFLKRSLVDETPQCSSFSYWVDPPTMTSPGVIHYKSDSTLLGSKLSDTLEYGTANTNIISLSGQYDGVAYNMTNMNFSTVGFALDGSGNAIVQDAEIVNSWSSSLADTFQSANIINDINALASQFSGQFTVVVPGSTKQYTVAQPISLLVVSGNTISPISGIYNIMSVSHEISNKFLTTLKLQRLVVSSANQVASSQGITTMGNSNYESSAYTQTRNIISTGKVDFGTLYPTFEDMVTSLW